MKTKEITQNPILDLRKRYDGRVRWAKFIEFTIPDREERNQFKRYVRNAVYGIRNEKALAFCGQGVNGKSVIIRVLSEIIPDSYFMYNIKSPASHITGKSAVFNDDVLRSDFDYIKKLLPTGEKIRFNLPGQLEDTPNIFIALNQIPASVELPERFIIINMPNTPIVANPSMAEELLEGRCGILDWFL